LGDVSKTYFANSALLLREPARPSTPFRSAFIIARQSFFKQLHPSTSVVFCGFFLDTNAGTFIDLLPSSMQERQDFPAHDDRQYEEVS
jgi:hypothetical protein